MGIFEIIVTVVKFLIQLWQNKHDPALAKMKAAAAVTKELNEDADSVDRALASNDGKALSAHFEELRKRIARATAGEKKDNE